MLHFKVQKEENNVVCSGERLSSPMLHFKVQKEENNMVYSGERLSSPMLHFEVQKGENIWYILEGRLPWSLMLPLLLLYIETITFPLCLLNH